MCASVLCFFFPFHFCEPLLRPERAVWRGTQPCSKELTVPQVRQDTTLRTTLRGALCNFQSTVRSLTLAVGAPLPLLRPPTTSELGESLSPVVN